MTIPGLRKHNPNSFFKREQFPDSFFQIAPDVEVLEETLQWSSIWLARRLEKREYVFKKGMLPIEKMLDNQTTNKDQNGRPKKVANIPQKYSEYSFAQPDVLSVNSKSVSSLHGN